MPAPPVNPHGPYSLVIPASLREGIVQAFLAALNGGSSCPARAYRTRTEPLQLDQLPAYVVRLRHEARSREGSSTSLSRLAIRVECLTRGEAPQDEALDPLLVYAVQTFYADNTDFSSLVTGGADPEITWDVENGYEDLAIAALDFEVAFKSATKDPSSPPPA